MNKKNIWVAILLVLICLVGGIGIGYVLFDNVSQNEDNKQNDGVKNQESEYNEVIEFMSDIIDHRELDNNIKLELKKAYMVKENLYGLAGVPYCGIIGKETIDKYYDTEQVDYVVSTQFKTINEMTNYLKQYMSEQVMLDYFNYNLAEYPTHIEENGKLYCANWGSGGHQVGLDDITIKLSENASGRNYIDALIEIHSYEGSEFKTLEYVRFRKISDKWIVYDFKTLKTILFE